jgi:translation initiation factor 3 subunit C
MKGFDESSESEEDIRTIKTQKDKKLETINAIIKDINNHIKINDFSSLMTDFERYTEELQKDFDNNAGIIYNKNDKEGVLPIQYLRILVKIEDAMNDVTQATKDKKVTLNKTNSVSLNKLKQKMKKYLPITGPTDNHLELQIAGFRENPVWSEDERKAVKAAEKKK